MIQFPDINPVIVSVGPLAVTWYSLSYVTGIIFGWYYFRVLSRKYNLGITTKHLEDFVTYAVLGIIIGGRLGYVILYEPLKYLAHPIDILKTYEGGMSFHGGVVGIVIATMLFCRKNKVHLSIITDLIATVAGVGIFLGRVANFINAELYGRITTVPWAVVFPGSDMSARHPSQLYEALFEGLLLSCIMLFGQDMLKTRGLASGVFLIFYSTSRIVLEFFREPDMQIGFLFDSVTMGQVLSLPLFILGCSIVYRVKCQSKSK
jgi:phosphatidylglycerol:prolipoprotein diacylglycerol transferase